MKLNKNFIFSHFCELNMKKKSEINFISYSIYQIPRFCKNHMKFSFQILYEHNEIQMNHTTSYSTIATVKHFFYKLMFTCGVSKSKA